MFILNRECTFEFCEFNRFGKLVVYGSKNDRKTIGSCLQDIVYPFAKSAADIGKVTIPVKVGKVSDGIYNHNPGSGWYFLIQPGEQHTGRKPFP